MLLICLPPFSPFLTFPLTRFILLTMSKFRRPLAWRFVVAAVILGGFIHSLSAATLEQIISRENPALNLPVAQMAVGRDGQVYISNLDVTGMANPGYLLRLGRDGNNRFGGSPGAASTFATANAQGVIASSNAHFVQSVILHNADLTTRATVREFSGEPRYSAPAHVEAGEGGDFYGLDQFKDRIVRISPDGKVVKVYPYERAVPGVPGELTDFRVDEKQQAFYGQAARYSPVRKIGFDGKVLWSTPIVAAGGFDVDQNGTLYAIQPNEDVVKLFSPAGEPAGEIKLAFGDLKPSIGKYFITNLRVWEGDIIVKRAHPTEVFLRFDAKTGALKNAASSRFERLAVTLPDGMLRAGSSAPFNIEFTDPTLGARPHWRVWARTVGVLDWEEWPHADGQLKIPAGIAGVYQIKITPEVKGWQRGAASEYLLQTFCEVRPPEEGASRGTANLWTMDNRTNYARGDEIPLTLLLRGDKSQEGKVISVKVRLCDSPQSESYLAESTVSAKVGQPLSLALSPALTGALVSKRYYIRAALPEFTCVQQIIDLGEGLQPSSFHRIFYGDYTQALWPNSATVWNSPDLANAQARRMKALGVNLIVERLNFNPDQPQAIVDAALRQRLIENPVGVAAEKTTLSHPLLQTLAAYGALGTREMGILLGNDNGLPLGSDFGMPRADAAKTDEVKERHRATITKVTRLLAPYQAFRGWSWAANWWLTVPAEEPVDKTAKAEYEAARKRAYETGKWEPLLENVANINLGFAGEATGFFNGILKSVAPGAVTAVSAPYRNGMAYPPLAFSNVDEVDLQAQWEQIAPPVYAPHNVDYYKRPGKPAWGHPELWNDSGTGDQILPTLFQMTMRGADGVGFANELPQWTADDSRSAQAGTASIYRALNKSLKQYGPWLASLKNDDDVAVVVSGRMIKLDGWKLNHFWGVFEAYISCLHAHHPASIVFAEDLRPDSLRKYKAVLVTGQKVEMEAGLKTALESAAASGAAVFYDDTCRKELVQQWKPLGIGFNQIAEEPGMGVGGDEATYTRIPGYMRRNLPALNKALDSATPPAAIIDNDEVWVSRRQGEGGKFLFVVNNTTPELGTEELWRVNLFGAVRVPVQAQVKIPGNAKYVYDVFAGKPVAPSNGVVTADLRSIPARIYALLPAAIGKVALRGPAAITAGDTFKWWAQVRDGTEKPIAASIPLRFRLIGAGGVLEERFFAAGAKGLGGEARVPINAGTSVTVQVTELFSGKSASIAVSAKTIAAPSLADKPKDNSPPPAGVSGKPGVTETVAVTGDYGPHLRDGALSSDGKTVLFNAMNWDTNLYAVDTATGKVSWQTRAGQYFAFAPQATQSGFTVQGFDFNTPEGYHLYRFDDTGKAAQRYALYGVPPRAPFRMYASSMHDRVNNFQASSDGEWIVSAGDLGVAVWSKAGKLLWSRDDWKKARVQSRANESATWFTTKPAAAGLLALDNKTLLLTEGMTAEAVDASTGQTLWKQTPAVTGEITKCRASKDGKTIVVLGTDEGGRLHVIVGGRLTRTLPTPDTYDFDLSPDGSSIALVSTNQLKLFSTTAGLSWILPGDDRLRFPRFSKDGAKVVACSDLGTLYVAALDGKVLAEKDLSALAVPVWLENGDLVCGNWMGRVIRLSGNFASQWQTQLKPSDVDLRGKILNPDSTPTVRMANWGNAEEKPWPLTPNLLAQPKTLIRFPNIERVVQNDMAMLADGKPDAPAYAWLWPGEVNQWAGLRFFNTITFELEKPVRATGITLVEDAKRTSSWLRDADLEYFDTATGKWVFLQSLLSNSAVHTHAFKQPVETTKLRIVLPFALYGNLRLAEIVLHGERVE